MAYYDTDGREVPEPIMGLLNAVAGAPAPTSGVKKKEIAPFKFQMPDWTEFAAQTGFGYNNPMDQMKDAFSIPTRGAGVFMGNKAPRYGTPAPQQNMHGNLLGLLQQFMQPKQGPQPFQRPGQRGLLG